MALTQTDLDNLEKAYASGALEVEIDGEMVKFVSGLEMRRRINWLKQELGLVKRANGRRVGEFRRGTH